MRKDIVIAMSVCFCALVIRNEIEIKYGDVFSFKLTPYKKEEIQNYSNEG